MKNNIIENLRLEMKSPRMKSSVSVRIGDTCTRCLHITLTSGGSVVSLDNALVASVLITKPNGDVCYNDCVISGSELQYTITSQSINVEGECMCQVQVTFDDGAVVTSPEFSMVVYQPIVNQNLVKSQNEYTSLTEQVVKAKNYSDNANAKANAAAVSEANAKISEDASRLSETNAKESEINSKASEEASKISETNAKASEEASKLSETNASKSEANAKAYEESSLQVKESVEGTASSTKEYVDNGMIQIQNLTKEAGSYASAAGKSETNAKESELNASASETNAGLSAEEAKKYYEDLKASGQLTLGETHDTAFYGDLGKVAYDHTLLKTGNPHGVTYEQVGADKSGLAQQCYINGVAYTDLQIANLINGAPTTLDTLKEIADAMADNQTVVEALNSAIGTKANQAEFDSHENNEIVHITATERTTWNAYEERIAALETLIDALGYPNA